MSTTTTTGLYQFDPYGNHPDNLIVNEPHALQVPGRDDYYFIMPKAAPFYVTSLQVKSAGGVVYTEGVDYLVGHVFVEATHQTGRAVAGSIRFLRRDITGVVYVRYQTVGGIWGFNDAAILEELSNKLVNPLIRAWAEIDTLPVSFPPVAHDQSVDEMIGFEEVTQSIVDLRLEIAASSAGATQDHINNRENPHFVTKIQVGLGRVEDFPVASINEAKQATRNDRYLTPARGRDLVNELANTPVDEHLNDMANPHQVTKKQVGLALVDNFATASIYETVLGSASNLFVTPLGLREAMLAVVDGPVSGHLSDTNNPHRVTKNQVGLGFVDDYKTANPEQGAEGVRADVFMTPQATRAAITAQALEGFEEFKALRSNPHVVTAAQVGLSNVPNYPTASYAEATAMEASNRLLTPYSVKGAIERYFIENAGNLVGGEGSPIQLTKESVGLGSVNNYRTATEVEMRIGELNNRYTTPLGVYQSVMHFAGDQVTVHLDDYANPHRVTAAQVGLSQVENYSVASDAEMRDGEMNDRYTTPLGVYRSIMHFAGDRVVTHLDDYGNPHRVTAAQVGAHTESEVNTLLSGKLDTNATATNADKVFGQTREEFLTDIAASTVAYDSGLLEGNSLEEVLDEARGRLFSVDYMNLHPLNTYVKLFNRDYSPGTSNNPLPLQMTYIQDAGTPVTAMFSLPQNTTTKARLVSLDHLPCPLEIYTQIGSDGIMAIWYKVAAESKVLIFQRIMDDADNNLSFAVGTPSELTRTTQPPGSVLVSIDDPITDALTEAFNTAAAELV